MKELKLAKALAKCAGFISDYQFSLVGVQISHEDFAEQSGLDEAWELLQEYEGQIELPLRFE